MMKKTDGIIIALAWPDTKVIREGKWYDIPMIWVGAIKNECYSAGHAAFLLINTTNGDIDYFDFGRYHTPVHYGRVRDKETDPDIAINLKALIKNNSIININEILLDRYHTKACHGDGRLTASIVNNIDYTKALSFAKKMQQQGAISYGPFQFKGSTCSRLVAQVVLHATHNWLTKLFILIPYTVSATPRSNNKTLNDYPFYYEVNDAKVLSKKSAFYQFKQFFNLTKKRNMEKYTNLIQI